MDYTKRENNRLEFWEDKKDYKGHYQVSNFGRIKSIKFGKEIILKPGTNKNGYSYVILYKNGKVKKFTVHRLVAEAFIPNPYNLPEVNHKDENKQNNVASNLEWCDAKYNHNYGTINERIAAKNTNGKCSKKVYQYTLDGQFVREWESTREAGRNGFDQSAVAACCRGKRKKYKDFIWRYK